MTLVLTQLMLLVHLFGGPAMTSADVFYSAESALEDDRTAPDSAATEAYVNGITSRNLNLQSPSRGRFWASSGYGKISKQYGQDSELVDAGAFTPLPTSLTALAAGLGVTLPLPEGVDGTVQGASARVSGEMQVINMHVGGAYDVVRKANYAVALGADIGFSQQHFQARQISLDLADATVSIPAMDIEDAPLAAVAQQMQLELPESLPTDQTVQSGFAAQNFTVFAEFLRPVIAARVGYQFDLGPGTDIAGDRRENTDRQDALLLGVSGRYGYGSLIVFARADAHLPFAGENDNLSYDAGDLYGVGAGVGYRFGVTEIGAAVTYRHRTDGTVLGSAAGQTYTSAMPAGYHVGIIPYVSVSPWGSSFSAYVKGGVQDEYLDYTLSITGENDFAPRVGATFGFTYGL